VLTVERLTRTSGLGCMTLGPFDVPRSGTLWRLWNLVRHGCMEAFAVVTYQTENKPLIPFLVLHQLGYLGVLSQFRTRWSHLHRHAGMIVGWRIVTTPWILR